MTIFRKFIIFSSLFFALVTPALAINLGTEDAKKAAGQAGYAAEQTDVTTFSKILGGVVKAALSFAGVIFLALMVYGGYLWMIARGAQDQIDQSKKIITGAIIGLILTVGAYSITSFVVPAILEKTSGPGAEDPGIGNPIVKCCWYTEIDAVAYTIDDDKVSIVEKEENCTNICTENRAKFEGCLYREVPQSECVE